MRYGDAVSQMLTLTHGVPQGSILGPVLFTTSLGVRIAISRCHNMSTCFASLPSSRCIIKLHWLPVIARIEYKILLTVFKSLNNLAYISELLNQYNPPRALQ